MAIAFVQHTGQFQTHPANTGTSSAFATQPVVGNYIVATATIYNDTEPNAITFSDNQGNSYTTDIQKAELVGGGAVTAIGTAKIATSSGSFTVTVASNIGTGNWICADAAEFSGLASTSWLDKTGSNQWAAAANAATVTASGANAQADELVIVSLNLDSADTDMQIQDPTTGYTELAVCNNGLDPIGYDFAYKIVSAGETSTAAWVHDSSQGTAVIATYLAAGAGGTTIAVPQGVQTLAGQKPWSLVEDTYVPHTIIKNKLAP